jgi:sugar phosphate isomerase/epimerase
VPDGVDGGVSTAPLSYKAWMTGGTPADREAILANVTAIAEQLIEVRRDTGRLIHLDIEPEPDCVLETTDETIAFFTNELRPYAAPRLAAATGGSLDQAHEHLADHLRVCFDCCHVAVEHEDPIVALHRLASADIRVGRVQLSSALRVPVPGDRAGAEAIRARLRPFADATYLHQVVARRADDLQHFPDLDAGARSA